MNIVFCTTCKGRVHHLARTLPQNMSDNAGYPGCRFVVLDYGDPGELPAYITRHHLGDIASGRLAFYSFPYTGAFRMAHAKNMAHRCGILEGADILVNMDADNYASPGFAAYIAEEFDKFGTELGFLWSNAKSVIGRARQGLAGRTAVSRNLFWKLGGYDERYIAWAPEDEDFKARARRLLGPEYPGVQIRDEHLYVIPHKDGLRFKEYPDAKPTVESEAESLRAIRESDSTIANFGRFGMGTVYKNFVARPIVLGPEPTRVFGIGMHKTATTSLYKALGRLGLDSAHWTGPWWAKRVWEEMQGYGRSLTVERHYAMADLPFTILYERLDRAYPGSKFILTVRSPYQWLESVRKHWENNRNRYDWDHDCFTHRVHTMLYGRKEFDGGVFLERYKRHNTEVMAYFKNRPDDLLVMDMSAGAGWPELCRFLKLDIPPGEYPREFRT